MKEKSAVGVLIYRNSTTGSFTTVLILVV